MVDDGKRVPERPGRAEVDRLARARRGRRARNRRPRLGADGRHPLPAGVGRADRRVPPRSAGDPGRALPVRCRLPRRPLRPRAPRRRPVPGRARQPPAATGILWQDVLHNGKQIEALWRARGTLSATRRQAVHGMYNVAARGLFAAAHPSYFAVIEAQRRLGLPLPRHSRLARSLSRASLG